MRPTSSTTGWIVAALVLVLTAGACSGDGAEPAALVSDPRPGAEAAGEPGEPGEPSADDQEFCELAGSIASGPTDDADAALAALDSLAEVAPAELTGDLEVLRDAIERLAEIDTDDPAGMEELMGIAMDPEVVEASQAISDHTSEVCGFDLDESSFDDVTADPDAAGDAPTTTALGTGSEIGLGDVDAVKDAAAAAGEAWPDKLTGTMISMGVDVQVSTGSDTPLTPEEALAACTALWTSLSPKNPEVTVEVLDDSTVVATASPDGACRLT